LTLPGLQATNPGSNETPAAAMADFAINDLLEKFSIGFNIECLLTLPHMRS
jgi:hypothetical protein